MGVAIIENQSKIIHDIYWFCDGKFVGDGENETIACSKLPTVKKFLPVNLHE